jgi:hypothetical protein
MTCIHAIGSVNRDMLLTYEEIQRLGKDGVNALVDYIKTCPGGSRVKTLSREDYLALTNYKKSLFLHVGGRIKHPEMTRAEFDKMTPRRKANFIRDGGTLTKEEK